MTRIPVREVAGVDLEVADGMLSSNADAIQRLEVRATWSKLGARIGLCVPVPPGFKPSNPNSVVLLIGGPEFRDGELQLVGRVS